MTKEERNAFVKKAAQGMRREDVVDFLLDEVKRTMSVIGLVGIQRGRDGISETEANIIDAQIGLMICHKQLCFDRLKCLGYEMKEEDLKLKTE